MTDWTCPASTCKSGSAMVISTPSTKQTPSSSPSFFCLDRPEPTWVPMGVMARSAPMLNRPMPRISITAPMVKAASSVRDRSSSGVAASK